MMPLLPFPEFSAAISRFKFWLEPLVGTDRDVFNLIDAFAEKEGKALYEALKIQTEAVSPALWLVDLWRRQFLGLHEPLPLAGNMVMKIDWVLPQTGLKRVAHFAAAMAQVHCDYLTGNLPPLQHDNTLLNMTQWAILRGAARRPALPRNEFWIQEPQTLSGHIVVLYRGYAWKVLIADDKARVATPAQLENVLYELVQTTNNNNELPFSLPSILPTEKALEIRAQLLSRTENNQIMKMVENAWFILSLDDAHFSEEEDALLDAAFGQGNNLWAYKPLNFISHFKDDRLYVHFEHSHLDPATVSDMMGFARDNYERILRCRHNNLPMDLNYQAMNWTIDGRKTVEAADSGRNEETGGTFKAMSEALNDYQRQSEKWMITIQDIFIIPQEQPLLKPYHQDAISHLLLQFGQLETYHKIRPMGELVDLRHLQDGRFDWFTPLTVDSIRFVQRLQHNQATVEDFEKAIKAHEKRLRITREGLGIWGWWLALKHIAKVQGIEVPIFNHPQIQSLTNPFIHTMRLFDGACTSHIAIAPPDKRGMGIHYAFDASHISFVITHRRSKINEIERFCRSLNSGYRQIINILKKSGRVEL